MEQNINFAAPLPGETNFRSGFTRVEIPDAHYPPRFLASLGEHNFVEHDGLLYEPFDQSYWYGRGSRLPMAILHDAIRPMRTQKKVIDIIRTVEHEKRQFKHDLTETEFGQAIHRSASKLLAYEGVVYIRSFGPVLAFREPPREDTLRQEWGQKRQQEYGGVWVSSQTALTTDSYRACFFPMYRLDAGLELAAQRGIKDPASLEFRHWGTTAGKVERVYDDLAVIATAIADTAAYAVFCQGIQDVSPTVVAAAQKTRHALTRIFGHEIVRMAQAPGRAPEALSAFDVIDASEALDTLPELLRETGELRHTDQWRDVVHCRESAKAAFDIEPLATEGDLDMDALRAMAP